MFSAATKSAHTSASTTNWIDDVFSTWLYTGNGSTQTITNGIDLAGKGGLVWCKGRNGVGYDNTLMSPAYAGLLFSDTTQSNEYQPSEITSYNANGFSLSNLHGFTNDTSINYVSWTFRKQAKFFDVVTYTGNGTTKTVAHNLGSVPGLIIAKRTDSFGAWRVYHRSVPGTALTLNSTGQIYPNEPSVWGNNSTTVNPTSTEFTVGSDINANGGTYVAYLFAHDAGGFGTAGTDNVISCGSYTADGTDKTISLGYEPQWVMVKRATNIGDWIMLDTMRSWSYGTESYLKANTSGAEDNGNTDGNPTATGFFIEGAGNLGTQYAGANQTMIYIAIRRPMKPPTSGTSVFSPIYIDSGQGTTGFPIDLQLSNYTGGTSTNTSSVDRLRGISSTSSSYGYRLITSDTSSETSGDYSKSFNNTGFSVPTFWDGLSTIYYNFRRASTFFDIVCYTGTGSATTQNHNLGAVPELMIVKKRSAAGTDWVVYSSTLGATNALLLDTNDASFGFTGWNSTSPTSSVFSLGTPSAVNASGATFVAYLFATVAGVSKVGSYTGTGTTKQVDCGFTGGARFVMIKRTNSTGDWYVWDTARGIVAGNDPYLLLNSTAAQVTNTDYIDPYSAGFEISSTAPAAINANGGSFIYLAIA